MDLGSSERLAAFRLGTHQPDENYGHPDSIEAALSGDGLSWRDAGVVPQAGRGPFLSEIEAFPTVRVEDWPDREVWTGERVADVPAAEPLRPGGSFRRDPRASNGMARTTTAAACPRAPISSVSGPAPAAPLSVSSSFTDARPARLRAFTRAFRRC